jgi:hypothetical protein
MPAVQVTVFPEAINALTLNPAGPVQQRVHLFGNRVVNTAKSLCPVDTGYLRSRNAMRDGSEEGTIEIYDDAEYALYVHEGTIYMAARPWLRDAFEQEMARGL